MKIDGTTLTIDLYDLCRYATPDQLASVADAMALNQAIRKNVVDSLLEGITEQESMPNDSDMDPERKRLIVGQDVLRDERIRHLEYENRHLTEKLSRADRIIQSVWDLYHHDYHATTINRSWLYNRLRNEKLDADEKAAADAMTEGQKAQAFAATLRALRIPVLGSFAGSLLAGEIEHQVDELAGLCETEAAKL